MNWSALKGHCSGRRHVWLLLGMLSAAIPLVAGTALIYVTNRGGTTIDVIDAATNKVVQSIGNIESPEVVRFSRDGRQLYIFSRAEPEKDFLIVMDRKSGKIVKKVPLSGWANEAQTTKDGKLILVCIRNTGAKAEDTGALDIIDTTTLEKVKSIPVRRGLHDIAITADGKFAAAGAPGGRFLVVFDLQKMESAWEVQYDSGVNPIAIENNPDGSGRRIFVNLGSLNSFSVVDFAKRAEVARIKAPDEPKGFGAMRGCESDGHGIGISPDQKTLWVNSKPANSVFAYSLPDIKLLGHVSLPEQVVPGKPSRAGSPAWITFTPDSKSVYVSSCGVKTVTAIDVQTIKEVARIPVGEMPDRISTLALP
jgi:YVTN family beta-propeller protein